MRYVRVRSWHIVSPDRQGHTLCGLREALWHQEHGGPASVVTELPAEGRSCETCLRIRVRREDRQR